MLDQDHEGEALRLLEKAGCTVEGKRVFIPERVVHQSIATVPQCVEIYDREGQPAISLEERKAYFGTGSDTPNVIDFGSGKRRTAVLQDVKRAAQILEQHAAPPLDAKAGEEIYRIAKGQAAGP